MRSIYCIALEGNGPTGVDWFYKESDRDSAIGNTGADKEIPFDLLVPDKCSHAEITDRADEAAWFKDYLTSDTNRR